MRVWWVDQHINIHDFTYKVDRSFHTKSITHLYPLNDTSFLPSLYHSYCRGSVPWAPQINFNSFPWSSFLYESFWYRLGDSKMTKTEHSKNKYPYVATKLQTILCKCIPDYLNKFCNYFQKLEVLMRHYIFLRANNEYNADQIFWCWSLQ